jgi:hypothetical protein
MKAAQLVQSRVSVLAAKLARLVCIVAFSRFVQRAFPRKHFFSCTKKFRGLHTHGARRARYRPVAESLQPTSVQKTL